MIITTKQVAILVGKIKMKILLTGGAGFIGSHVADGYIALGHEVVIVDNLSAGKKENLNKKAKFYQADICDILEIDKIFKIEKPDIVNHHSAQISVPFSVKKPILDAQINILGTLNLLELSVLYGVKKFIYANSGGAMYGEAIRPKKEYDIIRPLSPYGISKHTIEHYLILYHQLYDLDYVSLRYSNVYGPRQDSQGEAGVIAIFIEKLIKNERPTIFGDGNQSRDYIYIKDVVKANIIALELKNQVFNVGTGITTTTQQICDTLQKIMGKNISPIYASERKGDLQCSVLDCQKLNLKGWSIHYLIQDGLKETTDYYKK